MVGLPSSGEAGLMSANPRLAAQASCGRIGRMSGGQGQITESQWSKSTGRLDLLRSDRSDNENSLQVTRRRVRHSWTGHHRFIGACAGRRAKARLHRQLALCSKVYRDALTP